MAGILGIERKIEERDKRVDLSISEAFNDLKQLMARAQEMSATAKSIAQRIKEKGHREISDDEAVVFKSQLLSIGLGDGLDDPVTRKKFASQSQYYTELGKQLAAIVTPALDKGQISLTDVYCMVNRARGLELISTEDLLNACQNIDAYGLKMCTLQDGLIVLQKADFDSDEAAKKITDMVIEVYEVTQCGVSAHSLAAMAGLSTALSRQRLISAENYGYLCRDESLQGLLFYPNKFVQ